ncbi:Ornithine decarboxylase [Melia azedarach]|uniref:Ornithine decarboxylase n=1 Tax=Melia azedarach TaxID=155640 RepID=A0ACC1Y6R3_MELAZ|nr:Ornithine decarboxylase [Melia azedarach]
MEFRSKSNSLQTILDSPVVMGKTVMAMKKDGLTQVIQSIIFKRQEEEIDEPFYVLDLGVLANLYEKWTSYLPMIHPYYAVKCNSDTTLLGALVALGSNFDCASRAEIEAVLTLGVSPDRIIYANPCKPQSHINYAASVGVNLTAFDSTEELDKIRKWHPKCDLLIRIKVPDDSKAVYPQDSKFGAHPDEIVPLHQAAQASRLNVIGVSFHIGSAAKDFSAFRGAIAAAEMVFETSPRFGMTKMRVLDIGGGFGSDPHFHEAASIIKEALDSYFPKESGLTVIAKCTPFACKSNPENLTCKGLRSYKSTVFGPTCDADDKISTDHYLPELQTGDWLLFTDIGAYTAACGSNYNGFNTADIETRLVYSGTN